MCGVDERKGLDFSMVVRIRDLKMFRCVLQEIFRDDFQISTAKYLSLISSTIGSLIGTPELAFLFLY